MHRSLIGLVFLLVLSGCAIHHATPYVPDVLNAPQTAAGSDTAADCVEADTAAERTICGSPALGAANRAMLDAYQQALRSADVFARDGLIASQRMWMLGLPGQCHLAAAAAGPDGAACLQAVLRDRTSVLQAWREPPARQAGASALAQYVNFHAAASAAAQPGGALCETIAQRANAAVARVGSVDPAAMGAEEIAGSHGAQSAVSPMRVSVDLYDANAYGLFQRRARSVSLGGMPVITPVSLTEMVRAQSAANAGGRFSAFASQTGDYGAIDVFRLEGRTLVLATDAWGSTAPAAQGEAAHAGVWDVSSGAPAAQCLFDIYTRPADPGAFAALPNFAAWREALDEMRDSASPPVGNAMRRDQTLLGADTMFTLLHMPLLAVQQVEARGWTAWLRHRHDAVLDALFAWSARDPANKAMFDRAFGLEHAAAQELVHAYQGTEALSASEATQAAALAVMELLYEATVNIAPEIGSDLGGPGDAAGVRPRYGILALPQ